MEPPPSKQVHHQECEHRERLAGAQARAGLDDRKLLVRQQNLITRDGSRLSEQAQQETRVLRGPELEFPENLVEQRCRDAHREDQEGNRQSEDPQHPSAPEQGPATHQIEHQGGDQQIPSSRVGRPAVAENARQEQSQPEAPRGPPRQRDQAMPAPIDEPERDEQHDRRAGRGAVEEQHLDILLETVTGARFEQGSVGDRGQDQRRGSDRDVAPIDGPDPIDGSLNAKPLCAPPNALAPTFSNQWRFGAIGWRTGSAGSNSSVRHRTQGCGALGDREFHRSSKPKNRSS